uniref:Ubiquitin carboxyl-terminal hydrolase MINDY n=1 Tax=Strigamia maritima TaxID=126957 RepID=T1IVP6_STRMM
MAEKHVYKDAPISASVFNELNRLVWGPNLKEDVFRRWSQGFVFSEDEPTALVQFEGGPCAIIAPLQGFLLKYAIFKYGDVNWRFVSTYEASLFLIHAMTEILQQCSSKSYYVAYMPTSTPDLKLADDDESSGSSYNNQDDIPKSEEENFRTNLRLARVEGLEEVDSIYRTTMNVLDQQFGVLSFLYSVLLTKGISQVKNEMEDPNEPLIDGTYGHGSQCLINLMLTGKACSNVWDNDKDISGLKLRGISTQSSVGFLTLLEHLRYCEVGWFLKCPEYPIWVIGSETHLTVLFAKERGLCSPETPEAAARRIFKSYDPEGNNFISTILLGDVLCALDLVADAEYVEVMKQKLDSEGLGIILLNTFMEEFYPDEGRSAVPEKFILYHYNGLKRSCPNGKVKFAEGNATIYEEDLKCVADATPVLTCLQTKWPSIEVNWSSDVAPSII